MTMAEAKRKPFVLYERFQTSKKSLSAKVPSVAHTHTPKRSDAREYDWFCEPSATSPESTLCMAVLHRAILDLITPGTPDKYRRSAADWLSGKFGKNFEDHYALSFTRIIETLTPMSAEEFRQTIFSFAAVATEEQSKADPFRFQRR